MNPSFIKEEINPRPEANKFSSFFCLDCLQYVCAKCKSDKNNMHFNHRVTDSKYLIRGLKSNIRNFDLKMKHMESFQERINSFSNKFEEIIERDFYITLTRIDDLLDSVNKLKEYYVKTYKEKLGRDARLSMKKLDNYLILKRWIKIILSILKIINLFQ